MFLKSIEIRGFKSFADKTELIFKKGITAVVGPNGSGKSNISDAVRWVLGEQSVKNLRGGKMEDVIFAGTQFRKPVGLAQVSLTLDNSNSELPIDFAYVTISRRLYRSGESDYFINNTQCRLKDIQELFMDTGIGKEGYSLIGQGKIDAILSGKPEERRNLLEEASGIVKFKTRKEEAEKKLENTEQYLVRINDILSTYEERLDPLEVESNKAKEFINYSEKLKNKEVNLLIYSIDSINSRISEHTGILQDINSKIQNLNTQKDNLKEAIKTYSDEFDRFEQKTINEKQDYYDKKTYKQDLGLELNLLNERISNLHVSIDKSITEIENIRAKIQRLELSKIEQEEILINYQDTQVNLNREINDNEKNIINLNSDLTIKEDMLSKLKEDQIDYLNKISDIKNLSLITKNDIGVLEKKLEQIKSSCDGYNNLIKVNSNTKLILENEIGKANEEIKALNELLDKTKSEVSKFSSDILKEEKELKDISNLYSKSDANYNMLINFDKQYEGYNKSVKELMKYINSKADNFAADKCFLLGEIIKVEKRFETAFEIALGNSISDIITEDENLAKRLIEYLKQNSLGRATFLPLNIIKGKKILLDENSKKISGYIGIASELIQYDSKFSNVIQYILGRTIIAKDIDSAFIIAKRTSYNYKVVTLSGEIVNPGGALTGGSIYHKAANVISRKRELNELKEKLISLKMSIENINLSISSKKQVVKELDESFLNLKDDIYRKNIDITKLQGKVSVIENENQKLKHNMDVSELEIVSINDSLNNNLAELKKNEEHITELRETTKNNEITISCLEKENEASKMHVLQSKESLTELKIKKAQIDETVLNRIKDLERISKDIEELAGNKQSLEKETEVYKLNIENNEIKIAEYTSKIKDINTYLESLDNKFQDNEIHRIKMKDIIKINSENLERMMSELNKLEEDKHKAELSITKLETEKDTQYIKLNEELQLTYAEALEYKRQDESINNIDEYKREINKLRSKISELGVVNLGAIEEFREIKEKYTFMNSQREDLIKAKDELIRVINDMTGKMKHVFYESFNKLRELFNETFVELFKGGSADLILSGDDELSSNIDINVQPPGKKLQNINLMSGGEKVLSAIALLFAILKMKPTPFCILDEIEAALDDANVFRYAEFLKKFSNNIQFIVITHRKGTMEFSDVLYGVTMEEKGVSKIVSVDLNK